MIFSPKHILLLLLAATLWQGCQAPARQADAPAAPAAPVLAPGLHHFTRFGIPLDVQMPAGPVKGTLLLLPGWNFAQDDWCRNTQVCSLATARGLAVLMPDMRKSIYHSAIYPETRADWRGLILRQQLADSLLHWVADSLGICQPGGKNFILGLSTGGRGALLLAQHRPDLFTAVAALSGDYDQTLLPRDNLMRGIYGPLEQFPQRWRTDNPSRAAAATRAAVYLGHGLDDKVVPPAQTRLMHDSLKKHCPALPVVLHLAPGRAHDYAYWGSELPAVFQFFAPYLAGEK